MIHLDGNFQYWDRIFVAADAVIVLLVGATCWFAKDLARTKYRTRQIVDKSRCQRMMLYSVISHPFGVGYYVDGVLKSTTGRYIENISGKYDKESNDD